LNPALSGQLAAYNAARRVVVLAGCAVVDESPGQYRTLQIAADDAAMAFMDTLPCLERRALPWGIVESGFVGGVCVFVVRGAA